jgi:predicted nucleotidyltransferase
VFIRDLLAALANKQVPYCIVGGVAVTLHGVPRLTYDVDLVVPTTVEALTAVDQVLTTLGLRCRLPIRLADLADDRLRLEYRDERNLIAVTYTDPGDPLREVDILVSPPLPPGDIVARAVVLDLQDIAVYVASLPDLIAMKRSTGRAQDESDVAHLERLAKNDGHG